MACMAWKRLPAFGEDADVEDADVAALGCWCDHNRGVRTYTAGIEASVALSHVRLDEYVLA